MRSFIISVFATAVLSACGGSETAPSYESEAGRSSSSGSSSYADQGKQIAWNERGKEAIKTKLKDPDSAQFRNVAFYSGSGKPITCGEVNAKNSFGGYGGYERFIAAGDVITVLESEMVDGEMDTVWQQFCK